MTTEERLERLEKHARRWRASALCLGIGLLLVIGIAASPVVDESRIMLKDKKGDGRVLLCVEPDGDSRISFYNRTGLETLRIGAYDEGKPYISAWSTTLPRRELYVRFSEKK